MNGPHPAARVNMVSVCWKSKRMGSLFKRMAIEMEDPRCKHVVI